MTCRISFAVNAALRFFRHYFRSTFADLADLLLKAKDVSALPLPNGCRPMRQGSPLLLSPTISGRVILATRGEGHDTFGVSLNHFKTRVRV